MARLCQRAHQEANTAATAYRPVPPSRSHLTEGPETLQNFPVRHWSLFGNRSYACLLPLSPISTEQHQTVCIKSRMTAIVGKVSICQMSISTAITIFAP
ncbi:hypothetical protein IG631_15618 [Alternaria alternata]|nr:hypothetical protein IG631_15618 [Alternaria alternata]